jgi:flavodoxin
MKKALVAYYSRTGATEKMAAYIAEGVRFSGNAVVTAKISELKSEKDFEGYDAFILGCPTYHKDITENFKAFLFLADKAKLAGKLGGAFGPSTHSGEAPGIIFDTMEHVFKMTMTPLGPFRLMEHLVTSDEGMRSCQTYGRAIGEKLGA